jgi:hypothetical protein
MRPTRWFLLGMTAYVVLTVGGSLLIDAASLPRWVDGLAALIPSLAATIAIVSQVQAARAREGIERTALLESTSLAFFVTVLACLSYGFFQVWAKAPSLSGFWVYGFAMVSWAAISLVYTRRFR